jgi:hypothetical protein
MRQVNAYVLFWKREGKRPFARSRCKREDNVNIDFEGLEWEGVDWIYLAQYND